MNLRHAVCAALSMLFAAALPAFASPSGVTISGFQVRGPAGGNDEYIELRNTSGGNVDISGWKLQGCGSTSPGTAGTRATVAAGVTLTSGQYYLFTNNASGGYSGSVVGDATYATGFTDFSATNFSGVQLIDAANVRQDGVGSPLSPCREGTGFSTPTANSANDAYARTQDTDNNISTVWNILVTNDKMTDDIAYAIVKIIFDKKADLVAVHKEAENVDYKYQIKESSPVPWHPGALKYFAEKGVKM